MHMDHRLLARQTASGRIDPLIRYLENPLLLEIHGILKFYFGLSQLYTLRIVMRLHFSIIGFYACGVETRLMEKQTIM